MPSKPKKQQKTPLKQPISNSEAELCSPLDPDRFRCSLDKASAIFPSLIGKSSFVGRLVEVQSESRGCKLWLSEAAMAAYSISPASLVSVSLAPFGNEFSKRCPLRPFGGECGAEVGNYFALATVFPSLKVVNDGARLSSNLFYTMACPPPGTVMFVYLVRSLHIGGSAIQDEMHLSEKVDGFFSRNSHGQELYLDAVSLKDKEKENIGLFSRHDLSRGRTPNKVEYEASEPNSTSSSRLNLSSSGSGSGSGSGQLVSTSYEVTVSNLEEINGLCDDLFDINEILKDESAKKVLEACAMSWLYSRYLLPGNIVSIPLLSELCFFRARGGSVIGQDLKDSSFVEPLDHLSGAFVVDHDMKIHLALSLNNQSKCVEERGIQAVQHYNDDPKIRVGVEMLKLGGLSKEYAVLKDIIISSVMKNALSSFGLRTTKGVLLHGPPGTGKTSLARLCAHDVGVRLLCINGPEVVREYFGESEQALHEVFELASQAAPSVVFIDELDAIAPARTDGGEELSQRMVATLLNLMDGVGRIDGVLVVAATNRIECIDPALRRPGRLDRELEIGVPSSNQRLDILHTLLDGMDHALSNHEVQQVAITTHGFVGADLASLCNEAALVCLRRSTKFLENPLSSVCCFTNDHQSEANVEGLYCGRNLRSQYTSDTESSFTSSSTTCEHPASAVQSNSQGSSLANDNWILKITFEDFERARMKVRPSAMREVLLEIPKVSWKDVGGQDEVKAQLMEVVQWPQKHQDAFKRIGTRPPSGVLMFGPPGCSKTLLARAVASEAGLNFLAVKGPELFSKWVGESEKAVRSLFAKARANAPSIIFFDEIDSLAIARGKENDGISVSDRVMSQLLVELDGLHQRVDVTVIAATNRPDKIDPALLRPGRFDRLLYVGPPNDRDREEIFRIHLHNFPCSGDVNVKVLARLTEGCTGADIALICREAALAALEESLDAEQIRMEHLKLGLRQIRQSNIGLYQELSAKFQRLVQSNSEVDHGYQQRDGGSNGSIWATLMEFSGRLLHPWKASSLGLKTSDS